MANHVFNNVTIKHENPKELEKLSDYLSAWSTSEEDVAEFVSYLLNKKVLPEDLNRDNITEAIGAKWMTVEDQELNEELVLNCTTAWGPCIDMAQNLEEKGFGIKMTYTDEMPNFLGEYNTEDGDNYIDGEDLSECVGTAIENQEKIRDDGDKHFESPEDFAEAVYEDAMNQMHEKFGEMEIDALRFNVEHSIERMVEYELENK